MVRATSTLVLVAMLLSFVYGTASALSTSADGTFATEARTVLSGEPAPRLNAETTSATGIVLLPSTRQGQNVGTTPAVGTTPVFLPSTSTASTGPDLALALLVLGLAGTGGAFALAQRRARPSSN